MKSCAPAARAARSTSATRRVRTTVRDVVVHGVREQEAVLEHDADVAAERVEGDVAYVDAVDGDRAVLHVVEAGEQQADRRLPRAGRTDQGDGLAGRDVQREVTQHGLRPEVAVRHVVEVDGPADAGERLRVGLLGHEWVRVEDLEHAFGAGAGLLADREQRGEHPDRGDELDEIAREREERPDGELTLDREPAAEPQDRDLSEGRDHLQQRLVPRLHVDHADAGAEQDFCGTGQVVELTLLLAESLDHADARDRFVHDARNLTGALLSLPRRREERHPEPQRHPEERGDAQQRDDGEQRREPEHHDE